MATDVELRQRVLLGTVSNYVGKLVSMSVWFVLARFMVQELGPLEYGLWALVGSLSAYGFLLDLGVAGAVTKLLAEFEALGRRDRSDALLGTAGLLYAIVAVVTVLVAWVAAEPVASALAVPEGAFSTARDLVRVTGGSVAVAFLTTPPVAALRGLQRFDLAALSSTIGSLLGAAAVVAVLLGGAGAVGVVAIGIPLALAMQVCNRHLVRRAAPGLHFGVRAADRTTARAILGFGSSMLVTQGGDLLRSKSDEIVVGALLSISLVTPYALARRLALVLQTSADQFIRLLLPLAAELRARDEVDRVSRLYLVSTRLTLAFTVPTGATVAALAGPILTVWIGPAYARWAHVVVLLVAAVLIDTFMWAPANVALGMGRHRRLAAITIVSGAASLSLSLVLAGPLGLAGVAIGSLVPTFVECTVFVLPHTMSLAGVRWRDLGRDVVVPALMPLVPCGLVLVVAARGLRDDPSGPGVLVAVTSAIATYGVAYAFANRRRSEVEHLVAIVHRAGGTRLP